MEYVDLLVLKLENMEEKRVNKLLFFFFAPCNFLYYVLWF